MCELRRIQNPRCNDEKNSQPSLSVSTEERLQILGARSIAFFFLRWRLKFVPRFFKNVYTSAVEWVTIKRFFLMIILSGLLLGPNSCAVRKKNWSFWRPNLLPCDTFISGKDVSTRPRLGAGFLVIVGRHKKKKKQVRKIASHLSGAFRLSSTWISNRPYITFVCSFLCVVAVTKQCLSFVVETHRR